MRLTKRFLIGVGAVALVVVVATEFRLRAVDAPTAANVVVVNTATHPALTSRIDDPGRIPYQSTDTPTCTGQTCTFNFGAVPAGHRLAIRHLSGTVSLNSNVLGALVTLRAGGKDTISFQAPNLLSSSTGFPFDQPIEFYVNAGKSPEVVVSISSGFGNFVSGQSLTLIGYELDCNVGPCASIAR
jgi:hypothetical protein